MDRNKAEECATIRNKFITRANFSMEKDMVLALYSPIKNPSTEDSGIMDSSREKDC